MHNRQTIQSSLRRVVMAMGLLVASCGSDMTQTDMGTGPQCAANPMTHLELINSCTNAVAIDKPVRLAKFRPGAPLQPLPK